MRGRLIVRYHHGDADEVEKLKEAMKQVPDVLDRRFGAGGWSKTIPLWDEVVEGWHRIVHPIGIHWQMWIEEWDAMGEGVVRSTGMRCVLCMEREWMNGDRA